MDGFIEGNYWKGNEIYVDEDKTLYRALGLGKGKISDLFDKTVIANNKKTTDKNIGGNYQGEGMSLGGTYVISKTGEILLEFQQKKWGDHPSKEDILKALNIDVTEVNDDKPKQEASQQQS